MMRSRQHMVIRTHRLGDSGCHALFLIACAAAATVALSGAARVQAASGLDELDEKLAQAAKKIAAGVPKATGDSRKAVVAVLPFVDKGKRARSLDSLIADKLIAKLTGPEHKHLQVADRMNLDMLRKEQRSWVYSCFDQSDEERRKTARLLKADYLVVGRSMEAGRTLIVTWRLIVSTTGRIGQAGDFTISIDGTIRNLLRVGPDFTCTMYVERANPDGTLRAREPVQSDSTLSGKDQYQLQITPNESCYMYILLYDARGKAQSLFPMKGIRLKNRCEANQRYVLPDPDPDPWGTGSRSFTLDDAVGTETIYIVATRTEFATPDLARVLAAMRSAGATRDSLPDKIAAVTEVMHRNFETVKIVQFEHR